MTNFDMQGAFENVAREIGRIGSHVELLEESLTDKVMALDAAGWTAISGWSDKSEGLTLDALHEISESLRDMAATHPLFARGAQLRHAYVFGRGIRVSGLSPRAKKAVENPLNKDVLFSVAAFEAMNFAEFTDGNFVVMRNTKTDIFTTLPISQITGYVTDPDDNAKIRYVRRTWYANGEQKVLWIPAAKYKNTVVGPGKRGKGIAKTIKSPTEQGKREPVAQDAVVYIHTARRQAGWTWGFPVSFAAKVFALAYSNYLQDNAKLVKALSKFAWAVTQQTTAGANRAAVQVSAPTGVGGTAIMGAGNSLQSVGTPGSSVDFNKGQPLAAMVATSFGVPVIALLSSPGATGGSYGAATTLDLPTTKGMSATQDSWKVFFEEIYTDMGSDPEKLTITFPAIESDTPHRAVQSIVQAKAAGLLHQDEAREATLEVLDVPKLRDELPEDNPEYEAPAQGVSGDVPGGFDQDISNHDQDEPTE